MFPIIDGLQIWYASPIGDIDDPTQTLGQRLTQTVFAILTIMSFLSQQNAQGLRRRVLR